MAIDGVTLAAIKNDLINDIKGSRIDKIYQPEDKLLTFTLRQPGKNLKFLVSIHPQNSRIHLTEKKFDNPKTPPTFCMLLRKHLIRGTIVDIKQPEFERVLIIEIERHGKLYILILEIMGRYSNVILVNEERIVLDAMKRITEEISSQRQLYPGIKYQPPPPQDKLNPLNVNKSKFFDKIPSDFSKYCYKAIMFNFRGIGPNMAREIVFRGNVNFEQHYKKLEENEKNKIWESFQKIFSQVREGNFNPTIGLDKKGVIDYHSAFPLKHKNKIKEVYFSTTGKLFDYYYENQIKNRKFRELSTRLSDIIDNYLQKNRKQQKQFKKKLSESKNAEKYKKMGKLITTNIYQLQQGEKELEVTDFYDPDQGQIKIKLDPKLSPSENAQRYFKKYNKAQKSVKYLKREIGKLRHEEKYLEQVQLNIEQANKKEELQEIETELKNEGYINKQKQNKSKNNKPLPPHKFKSSQGYDILIGRNNSQNDRLTKKIANSHDIWLHTKKIAGSHVIIRNHTRDEIPAKTIKEAARLAAYYSKARMSSNVPIDYTRVKNVNKPKGAKPGLVYYDDYQTLYVDPVSEIEE